MSTHSLLTSRSCSNTRVMGKVTNCHREMRHNAPCIGSSTTWLLPEALVSYIVTLTSADFRQRDSHHDTSRSVWLAVPTRPALSWMHEVRTVQTLAHIFICADDQCLQSTLSQQGFRTHRLAIEAHDKLPIQRNLGYCISTLREGFQSLTLFGRCSCSCGG